MDKAPVISIPPPSAANAASPDELRATVARRVSLVVASELAACPNPRFGAVLMFRERPRA